MLAAGEKGYQQNGNGSECGQTEDQPARIPAVGGWRWWRRRRCVLDNLEFRGVAAGRDRDSDAIRGAGGGVEIRQLPAEAASFGTDDRLGFGIVVGLAAEDVHRDDAFLDLAGL